MNGVVHVESGQVALFDHIEPEGPMWAGAGPRTVESSIRFGGAFAAPPGVHVSISSIDAAHEQNLRLRLEALDVSSEGFRLAVHTWGDTRIGRLSVSWLAIGSSAAAIESEAAVWDV